MQIFNTLSHQARANKWAKESLKNQNSSSTELNLKGSFFSTDNLFLKNVVFPNLFLRLTIFLDEICFCCCPAAAAAPAAPAAAAFAALVAPAAAAAAAGQPGLTFSSEK